jgi:hypothetical protein
MGKSSNIKGMRRTFAVAETKTVQQGIVKMIPVHGQNNRTVGITSINFIA